MDPEKASAPAARRRRRRGPLLFAAILLVMATGAALLSPLWLPLMTGSDSDAITSERVKRRWLASWGLPMPGAPSTGNLPQRLAEHGLTFGVPVFIRIFKREFELEVWMKRDGVFHRFATYPVCTWSGALGPKFQQGDHQAPEGFYSVDQSALNPNSRWYRSFNLGYPNAMERANNRTGSLIMVHGGCASVGCFAMTNPQMDDIWQLVTAALKGGQKRFQVQVFPFRMSDENLVRYSDHSALAFWRGLKLGHDIFESTLLPPRVHVCRSQYGFEPAGIYPDGDGVIENRCPERTAIR